MVATIYLDPEAKGVKAEHLKALEGGEYGPILPSVPNALGHGTSAYMITRSAPVVNNPAMNTPRMYNTPYALTTGGPSSGLSFNSYAVQAASYSPGSAAPNRHYSRSNTEEGVEPEEGDY